MEHQIRSDAIGQDSTARQEISSYSFAGFSAADLMSLRSPFAYAGVGGRLCISFLDAEVGTANELDFVEELEALVRDGAASDSDPDELLNTLSRVAGRDSRRGELATFICKIDVRGTLRYAAAGHSALLMDHSGFMSTATDTTPPLGVDPRYRYAGKAVPLSAVGALVVYNRAFQRDLKECMLRAILRETWGQSASAVRHRIAGGWASSEAALRHYGPAALFVLKPDSIGRSSRYEGAFEVMERIGHSFGCPGKRSYGTMDFDFWGPKRTSEAGWAAARAA